MSMNTSIGIMDIGSNSIRLVIYELSENGAYRVVSEHKNSARLSERIGPDGLLHSKDILSIVPILSHYAILCTAHNVSTVRITATAAIRNATNSEEIVRILEEQTGLSIIVLSGEEEARFGFLGVINTIDIQDGIIVDIGGGSTEVTLFGNRKLLKSISFPFGSVNTTRQYTKNGLPTESETATIRQMVIEAIKEHPWITDSPDLPMIGLGGTIRALGKMSQKRFKSSIQLAHNYMVQPGEIDFFLKLLTPLSIDKRKRVDGLSKERADIIVPGLIILNTLCEAVKASQLIISGSGLRDGLFYEIIHPEQPIVDDVLDASIQNLLLLHPGEALQHVRHVNKIALKLYDKLAPLKQLKERTRRYLHAASLLYRIGTGIHYYQYSKHTQYIIAHARIDGFTHREIAICSLIASYKTKSRTHQAALLYKDLVDISDEWLIHELGTLLHLAIALDHSETQPVQDLDITQNDKTLTLKLLCSHNPVIEMKEISDHAKDFEKVWLLKIKAQAGVFSTN
ncbi:Ppx/GppA family phosphatase [Paenibacillus sp. SYP-B3998]|uniref:Chaperone protein DnaK n=1 Tax=Paenibacillus sp. SYP-B3998 TaxID=2678564 RepID=A0A6G4A0D8_9BACL|nr:Ppx/GppA phosphatase family protein [Paenibacillus sp. SYP-B3998]NEW07758.1 Ppx/GppA family phosphatase [Paenibacillus sp. SYP-B3998]